MSKPKGGDFGVLLRIRNAMAQRGLTMRELADCSGVPYGTLQNYLLGKHNIPAPTLGKIAIALDVSADWLILGRPAHVDAEILAELLHFLETLLNRTSEKLSQREIAQIFIDEYQHRYAWRSTPSDDEWEAHMHDVGDHPRRRRGRGGGPQ